MMSVSFEELPEDNAWLRRVANGLARGDADAEDIAQDAWLVALQGAPRRGALRQWLAGVARNKLRMRRRGEGRRRARDKAAHVASSAAIAGPDELFEREELLHLVARLVKELDETFRRVVLLRYVEGLTAVQIAKLIREPVGTVRWRLKSGLDRVREQLDARSGGDRRSWALLLVPITPLVPLRSGVQTAVAVAVAVLACASLVVTDGSCDDAADVGPREAPAALVRAERTVTTTARLSPGGSNPIAVADRGAPHGAFEGEVRDDVTGKPVAGAELTFMRENIVFSIQSDSQGRFVFEAPAVGTYRLTAVTAAGYPPLAANWAYSPLNFEARRNWRVRNLTFWLAGTIEHTGKVVSRDGAPVAGATVRVLLNLQADPDHVPPDGSTEVRTGADGSFSLVSASECLVEARHPQLGTARKWVTVDTATLSITLQLKPDERDGRLAGRVIDSGGDPIPKLDVRAWSSDTGSYDMTTTDADGRFVLAGLTSTAHWLVTRNSGYVDHYALCTPGDEDLRIVLAPGGRLTGTVHTPDGAPVPAFMLEIVPADVPAVALVDRQTFSHFFSHLICDPGGSFDIADRRPGKHLVRAYAFGYAPSDTVVVDVGDDTTPLALILRTGATLRGRVVSTDRQPIGRAHVFADDLPRGHRDGTLGAPGYAVTDQDGTWTLRGVTSNRIEIHAAGHRTRIVELGSLGGGPLDIELTPIKPQSEQTE